MSDAADGGDETAKRIAARDAAAALHDPVMADEIVAALGEAEGFARGVVIDGTFGAGGYARRLLEAGAGGVLGLDRDPEAIARGEIWAPLYDGRLALAEARFSEMEAAVDAAIGSEAVIVGVVLDLGVSSMQLDEARRGFSFRQDGPLDMRMEGAAGGQSAADLVNTLEARALADILFHYGEERASRRIAQAIVEARAEAAIETTARLAEIVASRLPRPKPGQPHAATRSFQALRIAVNDELGELERALAATERRLAPGGILAVVSFHSLEDRIVKRFMQARSDRAARGSRYEPDVNLAPAKFILMNKRAATPSDAETARNPRARSAKLRAARRTDAEPEAQSDAPGPAGPSGRARRER